MSRSPFFTPKSLLIHFGILSCVLNQAAIATEVVTYDWPTDPGEALLSDRYEVRVVYAGQTYPIETLMSESWDDPGGGPDVFRNRTFSWANFASDFSKPLIIEVEKRYGDGTPDIEVFPSGYNLIPQVSEDGRTLRFELDQPRYVSVNFKSEDNRHTEDGIISHMLMIFADPLETHLPDFDAPGTHFYSSQTTPLDIQNADTLIFPPGFHDLRETFVYEHEDDLGLIFPEAGQTIYLSGGAYVIGRIFSKGNADGLSIRGRGVLSGRAWDWDPENKTRYDGHRRPSLIEVNGSNITVEGIAACDNNMHGIVPGPSATMRNVKLWGWHYNNDGFRPWGGTVRDCFIRAADDTFYVAGGNLEVYDCVIWQSFNGAVVTCGWGNPDNPYNTADFLMKDSHILYPEWNGIGNNNGILASQLPYNATSQRIRFENIRVDGNVSAIVNLKRNEAQEKKGEPGGIRDVTFKNLTLTGQQVTYNHDRTQQNASKSLIRGDEGFRIENISFENLSINGLGITEANAAEHFTIDPATSSNIRFTYEAPSATQEPPSLRLSESATHALLHSENRAQYRYETSLDLESWETHPTPLVGNGTPIRIPIKQGFSSSPCFIRLRHD